MRDHTFSKPFLIFQELQRWQKSSSAISSAVVRSVREVRNFGMQISFIYYDYVLFLQTLASQVKGPSSDALEESCRMEAMAREKGSDWEDVLGSGKLMKRVVRDGRGGERPTDGHWVTIKVSCIIFFSLDIDLACSKFTRQTSCIPFDRIISIFFFSTCGPKFIGSTQIRPSLIGSFLGGSLLFYRGCVI